MPDLRHASGEGHGVSQQAAHGVHRSELRDQSKSRRWWWAFAQRAPRRASGPSFVARRNRARSSAPSPARTSMSVRRVTRFRNTAPSRQLTRCARLRCAHGGGDHQPRAVEALPEFRLPGASGRGSARRPEAAAAKAAASGSNLPGKPRRVRSPPARRNRRRGKRPRSKASASGGTPSMGQIAMLVVA